jgi:hypothetical protein
MLACSFCVAFAEPDSVGCNGSEKLKGTTPGIMGWNNRLNCVADNFQLLNDIQRAWSYLESLFIHSEEVKKELPEATKRFERIDIAVKVLLSAPCTINNDSVCISQYLSCLELPYCHAALLTSCVPISVMGSYPF